VLLLPLSRELVVALLSPEAGCTHRVVNACSRAAFLSE
jgi:hypothetical protein